MGHLLIKTMMETITRMLWWMWMAIKNPRLLATANLILKWMQLVTSRLLLMLRVMTKLRMSILSFWRTSKPTAISSKRSTANTCSTWRVTSSLNQTSQLVWPSSSLLSSRSFSFCHSLKLLSRKSSFAQLLASIAASWSCQRRLARNLTCSCKASHSSLLRSTQIFSNWTRRLPITPTPWNRSMVLKPAELTS